MPAQPTIAVIQFPGTNCELETIRALERNGLRAELFRWNEKRNLQRFDGVVLAGGFSYEDRGRSGLIASREPILREVEKLARRGGVVLGICNGAQILVETGLVPNFEFGKSTLALTHNHRIRKEVSVGRGFFNSWINIKPAATKLNAFNQFAADTILRIPIAHAEGRFCTRDEKLLDRIFQNGQNAFVYCDDRGEVIPAFPVNPNGSVLNLAGVTNPDGNVLALMPHPERATAGDPIFASMRTWLTGRSWKPATLKIRTKTSPIRLLAKPKVNVELFVKLKIIDNEALSLSAVAKLDLVKWRWFGFDLTKPTIKVLAQIVRSGELLNAEKEIAIVKIGGKFFSFDKSQGFVATKFSLPQNRVLAVERETNLDAERARSLNRTLGRKVVRDLRSGVLWGTNESAARFAKATRSNFFHHPAATELVDISL